jgi:YD repeat-containing protein
VQVVVDQAGNILQRTLSQGGSLLNSTVLGSVNSLPLVGNFTNGLGQLVKVFQYGSGALIEVTYDALGNVTATKVLQ